MKKKYLLASAIVLAAVLANKSGQFQGQNLNGVFVVVGVLIFLALAGLIIASITPGTDLGPPE